MRYMLLIILLAPQGIVSDALGADTGGGTGASSETKPAADKDAGWSDAVNNAKAKVNEATKEAEQKKTEMETSYANYQELDRQVKKAERATPDQPATPKPQLVELVKRREEAKVDMDKKAIAYTKAEKRAGGLADDLDALKKTGPSASSGGGGGPVSPIKRLQFGLGPTYYYAEKLNTELQGSKGLSPSEQMPGGNGIPSPEAIRADLDRDPFNAALKRYQDYYDSVPKPIVAKSVEKPPAIEGGAVKEPMSVAGTTWAWAKSGKKFCYFAPGGRFAHCRVELKLKQGDRDLDGSWRQSGTVIDAEWKSELNEGSILMHWIMRFTIHGDRMQGEGTLTSTFREHPHLNETEQISSWALQLYNEK